MDENSGFKHIKVTVPEDDEVIEAGIASPAGDVSAGIAPPQQAGDPPRQADGPRPSPSPKAGQAPEKRPAPEELDPAPMPFTQKAVIVAALALIIVAVVYYFTAMR